MNSEAARRYRYVGPEEIRARVAGEPAGFVVDSPAALAGWLRANPDARTEGATFVVDAEGRLRIAPRRSEHVACAGGGSVLSAGELRFSSDGNAVSAASNQSTGYCPEPSSFAALASALDAAGIARVEGFTAAFTFRRCTVCAELNVVKESWFVCAACDAELPAAWNFVELVVFVGLQASGKSTWYRERFAETHTLVSKDLMRNNRRPERRQRQLVAEALAAGQSVVVDNTNPTVEERAALITLAREAGSRVVAVVFETPLEICLARNAERSGHARVPDVALFSTKKRMQPVTDAEGFDAILVQPSV